MIPSGRVLRRWWPMQRGEAVTVEQRPGRNDAAQPANGVVLISGGTIRGAC